MSKRILCLLSILLTIIAGTILHLILACDCAVKTENRETVPAVISIAVIPENKTSDLSPALPDSSALKIRQEIREKVNANPLNLYFETGQTDINLDQEEKQKLDQIINYFKNVTDAEFIINGHTDNSGSRADNIRLGQIRADFLKALMLRNGVPDNKIECISKGPDEPKADTQ